MLLNYRLAVVFAVLLLPSTRCIITTQQKNALIDLYLSTNGSYWINKWNVSVLLNGSICADVLYGVSCDSSNSHIIHINLTNNSVSGSIPDSIGDITTLEYLDICRNELEGNIPNTLRNLTSLQYLILNENKINGTIPNTIENLRSLRALILRQNKLSGSIPATIANLTSLNILDLSCNELTGSIPSRIGHLVSLQHLSLYSNKISGSIPNAIGNLTSLQILTLFQNKLTGTIPDTVGELMTLQNLYLFENQLSGRIPVTICNLISLKYLFLYRNALTGSIPECIGKLTTLTAVNLHLNHLTGSIPAVIGNLSNMTYLSVAHNHLSGSIPSSIARLPHLRILSLANNSLSCNIVSFLVKLLNRTSSVEIITFADNLNLYGDVSNFKSMNITINTFIAQHCDLYGVFDESTHFVKAEHFAVYDNRLSGVLPDHLLNKSIVSSALVLASNLFTIENKAPIWLTKSSLFVSVKSLYITHKKSIMSWILISFCISIIIFIFVSKIITKISTFKKHHISKTSVFELFLQNIMAIGKLFDNITIWFISFSLIIAYYFNSIYFRFCTITQQISLSFYLSVDKKWDWVVMILWLLYISVLGSIILYFQNVTQKKKKRSTASAVQVVSEDDIHDNPPIYRQLLTCILYSTLFIICNALVVLSVICDYLPENNTFHLSAQNTEWIKHSIGFVLAINSAFITPKFVDSLVDLFPCCISQSSYITKYRPFAILVIRTWCILIIPLLSSISLASECGNHWAQYWNQCSDSDLRDAFNINLTFDVALPWQHSDNATLLVTAIKTHTHTLTIPLLSSDWVCEPQAIQDINWNKCIRFFTANWSSVLIQKLCFMMLLPIFMIFIKTAKHKLLSSEFVRKNCTRFASTKHISIDMEYAMILTKCETMIIWGAIAPLIIPLSIMSIRINYFAYHWMVNKQNWRLEPFDNNVQIPVSMLWLSLFISEVFICSFALFCMNNESLFYALASMIFIIDLIYIFINIKNQEKKQLELELQLLSMDQN